jgi:hypothetical protein
MPDSTSVDVDSKVWFRKGFAGGSVILTRELLRHDPVRLLINADRLLGADSKLQTDQ